MNQSKSKNVRKTEVEAAATRVAKGQDFLQQAQTALVVDEPMNDPERHTLSGANRVTDEAMTLLANIYDRYQALMGVNYDANAVREAIAFEKEQRPIAAQARMLADRLSDQIVARRGTAAMASLALYQTMKGAARFKEGAELRPLVKQVAALMKTGKRKAKVQSAEPANPATIVAK